jgi:hypothetical protein
MQELSNSTKRPNLRSMGIKKGEGEVDQDKGIHNIFNKIIAENIPNLKKELPIRYRKPQGHQADLTKIKSLHGILSLKQLG